MMNYLSHMRLSPDPGIIVVKERVSMLYGSVIL
jgi:hypothetical protein